MVARPTQAYRDQSKTEINGQVPQEPTLEDFQFIRYSNRSCKQKRIRVDLSTDEEFGSATTIIDDSTTQEGPRLQYYHSRSRLPMRVGDWDIDSDDESDNEWIDQWAQGVSFLSLSPSVYHQHVCLEVLI